MKSQLTAKYLQFVSKKNKKQDAGFTLIELLVVIIIIGILSAIALPSFLNQAAKARGAEAKSNVGAMNRAQQAYFLEQQKFTATPDDLGLSMKNSENFTYTAEANGDLKTGVTNYGESQSDDIKSYAGGVFYTTGSTTTILCEAKSPGPEKEDIKPTPPQAGTAAVAQTTNPDGTTNPGVPAVDAAEAACPDTTAIQVK